MKFQRIVLISSVLSFSFCEAGATNSDRATEARKQCDSYVEFYQPKCKSRKLMKDDNIFHFEFNDCGTYGEKVRINFRNVPSSEPPLLKNHLVCLQEIDSKGMAVGSDTTGASINESTAAKKTEIDRYFEDVNTKEFVFENSTQTRRSIYPDKNFYIDCTISNKNQQKCSREIVAGVNSQKNLVGFEVAVPTEQKMNEIRKGASVTSMTTLPPPWLRGATPDAAR